MRNHPICVSCLRLFAAVAAVLAIAIPRQPARSADLLANANELQTRYVTQIEALAQWCDKNGMADEAQKTRRALPPHGPDKLYLPILPKEVGPAKRPPGATPKAAEWDDNLTRLRHDHAAALYDIARRAVRANRAALAFELILAAVEADPDHEPSRRLLGYQKFRDQWLTLYEVKKIRGGFLWSDQFGWLPKAAMRRYEDGQRLYDGRWIPAAKEAELRQSGPIEKGWEIETEHYSIRTNHSIEVAVAMGVKLERLYRLWQQIFIRYYATEADVIALFDGKNAVRPATSQRHRVVCFRDRDDYRKSLQSILPNVDTEGLYLDRQRQAYFFVTPNGDDRTLYHEATHQLFHESRPVASNVAANANFWIIEGIAMYMESLHEEDGYYVLGGFNDERMQAAQYRLLHDNFYVPLEQFSACGIEKLQKDPRIATLYSQAAGLTHFLIYYKNGLYRDALVQYLTMVYSGADAPDTLAKLTDTSFQELDKQYRDFMENAAKQNGKNGK